jgi:hypothetical protein
MSVIVLNAESVSQFEQAGEFAELRDATGRVIGFFHPANQPRVRSNLSREELEEIRRDRSGGKTLDEFFPPRMGKQ